MLHDFDAVFTVTPPVLFTMSEMFPMSTFTSSSIIVCVAVQAFRDAQHSSMPIFSVERSGAILFIYDWLMSLVFLSNEDDFVLASQRWLIVLYTNRQPITGRISKRKGVGIRNNEWACYTCQGEDPVKELKDNLKFLPPFALS